MTHPDAHPLLPHASTSLAPKPSHGQSRDISATSSRAASRIGLAAMDYELGGAGSRSASRASSRGAWIDGIEDGATAGAGAGGGPGDGRRSKAEKKDRRVRMSIPRSLRLMTAGFCELVIQYRLQYSRTPLRSPCPAQPTCSSPKTTADLPSLRSRRRTAPPPRYPHSIIRARARARLRPFKCARLRIRRARAPVEWPSDGEYGVVRD